MTEHAKLSPSGSKRWFACAGSLVLEAPIPNKSSTYSDDGTAMHHVAALCLTEHWRASKYVGQDIPVNSRHEEPRFVEFTDEMAELVQGYVDTVRKIGIGHRMLVETRVDFSEFVQIEDQFGTADCIIVDLEQGELGVYDLKTGHTPVTVPGNTQAMFYALGALRYLMDEDIATSAADPFDWAREQGLSTIRIGIYQPKVFTNGLEDWVCTMRDLKAFANTARSKAASVRNAEAMHGKIPMEEWDRTFLNQNPNEEECAFCRAMTICPSAQRKVIEVVGADFDVITDETTVAKDLVNAATPVRDLSTKMQAVGFVEDWCKAVRAETERRLLNREEVPGFGLELGRQGPRKWTDKEAVEKLVREQFRLREADAYNMKLKSPTQFEDQLTKPAEGEDKPALGPRQWKKLQALITRSDPKPSVKPATAIKKPYVPPAPSDEDFITVADEPADDDLY